MKTLKQRLFGTDGIRGKYGQEPMTKETIAAIARATARFYAKTSRKPSILIGKDTRESSDEIEKILSKTLSDAGVDVLLVGQVPTPAVAYLTKEYECTGGIMISASHNPWEDNGLKFFDRDGFKLGDKKEAEFEKLIHDKKTKTSSRKGNITKLKDAAEKYMQSIHNTFDEDLKGVRIVLDCAHGAASQFGTEIFQKKGAEVIALNNTPNGKNINLNCGSLYPATVAEHVRMYNADMGIALDGDADRVILIDENGEELCGDTIMAICGMHYLQESKLKKNTLVVTQYSNMALRRLFEKNNCKVVEVENGDKYVAQEMKKRGAVFGGEQSGHLIFLEHTTTGDGLLSACQVLNVMRKKRKNLSELASVLRKNPQTVVSIDVREKIPLQKLKGVQQIVKDAQTNLGKMGRVLLRYSGTQNKARIMVEGVDPDEVEMYAQKLSEALKAEVGVFPF